ncbi:WYL domain-containing protein [Nocardia salmonicida]|uniref:WYL domain-containing protein n=1 Tax=Nocardia salmonicida TaxID=53431 RepID=UPI0036490C95
MWLVAHASGITARRAAHRRPALIDRGAQHDVWPCNGEAILDLAATRVAPFAGDAVVEALDDGRTRLSMGSWSWAALAAALARFDADIEVVGPQSLRDAFAALSRRADRAAQGSA